jgi:hypothetical protein
MSVLFSCRNNEDNITLEYNLNQGDKIPLEYNLNQGEILKQNIVTTEDLVMKFEELELKLSLATEMKVTFEVKESQKDSYTFEMKIKEMKMTVGMTGFGNFSHDSNAAEDAATPSDFSLLFKAIIDKPVESVITKTGKLQSVKGLAKLIEEARQQAAEQLGFTFSEEVFKLQLEQSIVSFSDKPVGTGDSWDYKMATGVFGFAVRADMKSTLESIEGNVLNIDINGTVYIPEEESEQEINSMNGAKDKISLNGTQKGILKVNKDTGWVISSDMAVNFNGNMEVMGMKVPLYVASTIKVTGE